MYGSVSSNQQQQQQLVNGGNNQSTNNQINESRLNPSADPFPSNNTNSSNNWSTQQQQQQFIPANHHHHLNHNQYQQQAFVKVNYNPAVTSNYITNSQGPLNHVITPEYHFIMDQHTLSQLQQAGVQVTSVQAPQSVVATTQQQQQPQQELTNNGAGTPLSSSPNGGQCNNIVAIAPQQQPQYLVPNSVQQQQQQQQQSSGSGQSPTSYQQQPQSTSCGGQGAGGQSSKDTTYTKIFVGGLPYHTTDKSLRKFFETFGEIEEAVVITDRQTGKSRGYGFVTMADREAAERAVKDANPIIDGRKSNVNLAYLGAKPRNNNPQTNGLLFPTRGGGYTPVVPSSQFGIHSSHPFVHQLPGGMGSAAANSAAAAAAAAYITGSPLLFQAQPAMGPPPTSSGHPHHHHHQHGHHHGHGGQQQQQPHPHQQYFDTASAYGAAAALTAAANYQAAAAAYGSPPGTTGIPGHLSPYGLSAYGSQIPSQQGGQIDTRSFSMNLAPANYR